MLIDSGLYKLEIYISILHYIYIWSVWYGRGDLFFFLKREALLILDNYIKMIQLYKIHPGLCITKMHTTYEKGIKKKRTPWPKNHAAANYHKWLHLHPLRKPKQLLDYEVGSRDNASNEETARARADIAVTQPIKVRSKVFTWE